MAEGETQREVMMEAMEVATDGPSEKLERYTKHAQGLIHRCHQQSANISGKSKLERKIRAELKFLKRLSDKPDKVKESSLNSSNLMNIEGIVAAMESFPDVTHVMKPFSIPGAERAFVVDVICNQGYTWVKVIARKAQALHLIWAGGGQFGEKDISDQAQEFLNCTKLHPKNYTLPQVIFIFCQGVTQLMKQHLEEMGIQVQGKIVEIDADTESKLIDLRRSFEDSESEEDLQIDKDSQLASFSFDGLQDGSDIDDEDEDGHELLTASELFKMSGKTTLMTNTAIKSNVEQQEVAGNCENHSTSVYSQTQYEQHQCNVEENTFDENDEPKDDKSAVDYKLEKTSFDTSQFGLVATPNIKKVNLDVSTLIVLVSNVCHGRCNFVFKDDILSLQAESERKGPVLPALTEFMKDKDLYACKTAVESFHKILHIVGGPEERERGDALLKKLTVVDDCISEKTKALKCSAQIKKRAKIVFGTGDYLQAITMSANMGFVRAAENQGFHYAVYLHESRALTEQKESTASLFEG